MPIKHLTEEQKASQLKAEELYARRRYREEKGSIGAAERESMRGMDEHLGRKPGWLEKMFLSILGD